MISGPQLRSTPIRHPGWTRRFPANDPILFVNVATSRSEGDIPDGSSTVNLAAHINSQSDPTLSWAEIEWFRSAWDKRP